MLDFLTGRWFWLMFLELLLLVVVLRVMMVDTAPSSILPSLVNSPKRNSVRLDACQS